MVRKQGIAVNKVQLTLARMWEPPPQLLNVLSRVKTKQAVKPFLNGVIFAIPDWFIQFNFEQASPSVKEVSILLVSHACLVLFTKALDELKRQTSASALISMHC